MARPKKNEGPHIVWRKGRAYADLRAYEDVGGKKGALATRGSTWGTTDPEIALELFEARLAELGARRKDHTGVAKKNTTTLVELVRHHLVMKAKGETSDSHMFDLESRLRLALEFFGRERDPRTIDSGEVRAWSEDLAKNGTRKPGTVRHYLNALSGVYGRAREGQYVSPGYNPVADLMEKPTGYRKEPAKFFEVAEATLLLEAARVVQERDRGANAAPGLYAIIATFLLTGGRFSEVVGLDVDDVSFDRGLVRFRPNAHRRLKTQTSVRTVPLWPQLREALQLHVFERGNVSGLLFPGAGGHMIGDIRKSLDKMGTLCGMDAGEVRTRAFRHTYCSARLQTVQRILKPGRSPDDEDAFDYVEVSRFQVQKEMGHGGAQLVDRIYGHAQRLPYRSEVVEYRVEQHRDTLGE
jgi:integrase